MKLFHDIKATFDLTREIYKAQKAGEKIEIRQYFPLPVKNLGYWSFTPESCLLLFKGEMEDAVKAVFSGFDEETRKKLTFAPKDGEWADRIRFWQEALRPALPPHLYHKVMLIFLDWAVRCSKARLGGAA